MNLSDAPSHKSKHGKNEGHAGSQKLIVLYPHRKHFFVAGHSVLGVKERIWSQVVGGEAPLDAALPPKVVISCRRDICFAKKVAFCVDETTPDFDNVRFA